MKFTLDVWWRGETVGEVTIEAETPQQAIEDFNKNLEIGVQGWSEMVEQGILSD
jgi:hypothetical protein